MAKKQQHGRWVVEQIVFAPHLVNDLLAGSSEVRSFDDEDRARRECDSLEGKMRASVNPFDRCFGGLTALTSLDPAVFRDWLLDAGIDPPAEARPQADWKGWYERTHHRWDDLARQRFWERLDRLAFFRVVERRPRKGYVVMEVGWLWCDEPPFFTDPECRRAVEVFADRADADRRRRELERQRRAEWPPHMEFEWGTGSGELADAPLYEVVEVDWEADP